MTLTQAKALTLSRPLFLVERLCATPLIRKYAEEGWRVQDYEQTETGWYRLLLIRDSLLCGFSPNEMMVLIAVP